MENHEKIRLMKATENGVIFFPTTGNQAAMCTIDENDKVHSKVFTYSSIFDTFDFIDMKEFNDNLNIFKVLIFDAILIIISALFKNIDFIIAASFFSLFVSKKLFMLFKIIYEMKSKKGTAKTTAKFVGACNMVTNAYNDLGRVPTLEEVKEYSCYSYYCSMDYTFKRIIKNTFFSLIFFLFGLKIINPLLCLLFEVIFLLLLDYLFEHGHMLGLQSLVSSEPSDKELEVAIDGVKLYIKLVNDIYGTL